LATEGATDEVKQPLSFKAGKDIKIEINHYNPLRTVISVEDSSISYFLSDTAKYSKLIVLPKVSNLPKGDVTTQKVATLSGMTNIQLTTQNTLFPFEVISAEAHQTDCDKIQAIMSAVNLQKDRITSAINDFQGFASRVDVINDSHDNLAQLQELTTAAVTTELRDNFIASLNDFLIANDQQALVLAADPSRVSSRQIEQIEGVFHQNVKDQITELDKIQKQAEALDGHDCQANFLKLYKEFSGNLKELQDKLKDFETTYTQKAYPAFKKDLSMYDQLKKYLVVIPPYISKDIPIYKDEHFIKIFSVESTQSKPNLYDIIHIESTHGWKLDVAAGFFVSGLSDDVFTKKSMDSIYSKKYVATGGTVRDTTVLQTFNSINKQKQASASFGGMLYLHAHTQTGTYFNYGVSLGFGALFNDQARWAGSFGPTILIGKKQRFNITPSIILGQVDRLSAPYQTNKWYSETIDNVPTFKAWKASWAVGFSWNL
jgi:hypothetical protein